MVAESRDYQCPPKLDPELDYALIVRITRAHRLFAACVRAGLDADDLTSEVVLRVIRRQQHPSRYDPQRGTLGVYLTVLTRGILANLLTRQATAARQERTALRELQADADLAQLEALYDVTPVPSRARRVHGVLRRR